MHQLVPLAVLPAGGRLEIVEVHLPRATGGADQTATASMGTVDLWLSRSASGPRVQTFADNLSGDEQKVFDGPITVTENVGDTLLFDDVVMTFTAPFLYDAANGPLLVDLRMPALSTHVRFDCRNDASMYMAIRSTPGLPTEGPIASGCGHAFQIVVQ